MAVKCITALVIKECAGTAQTFGRRGLPTSDDLTLIHILHNPVHNSRFANF